MSLQLTDNFSSAVKNYISNPTKQINLATTVIRFAYYGAFFLGLFFILIAFGLMLWNPNYRNGNSSKKPLIILGYVGIGLVLFSLWTTINSFYSVVGKINENIKVKKNCSLFQFENPVNAVNIIASETLKEQAIANAVNAEVEVISQRSPSERPFSGIADASTNSFTKVQDDARSGRLNLPGTLNLGGIGGNTGVLNLGGNGTAGVLNLGNRGVLNLAGVGVGGVGGLRIGQINPRVKEEIISEIDSNSLNSMKDVLLKVYKNGDVENSDAANIIGSYIEKSLMEISKKSSSEGLGRRQIEEKLKDALDTYLKNADGFLKTQIQIPKPTTFFQSIGQLIEEDIPKIIRDT